MNALRGRGIYNGSRRVVLFDLAGDSDKGGRANKFIACVSRGESGTQGEGIGVWINQRRERQVDIPKRRRSQAQGKWFDVWTR